MTSTHTTIRPSKTRRRIVSAILMIGFGIAAGIYLNAGEMQENPFAEYEQSKRFSHEVQRVGGKMALVATDLSTWFSSLWEGQQLAWSVASCTLVIAALYYVFSSGSNGEEDTGDCGG